MSTRERVTLFGASGTMGFQVVKELRRRAERYDLTLLLLPGDTRAKRLEPLLRGSGVDLRRRVGVAEGSGVRVVWGDATDLAKVRLAVKGADWVLNTMAYISPQADYRPEIAWAVNDLAVGNVLAAICEEPEGAERICYVHTGSVAQTGNRPATGRGGAPGTYVGRVGDPMNPSVYDEYALSKIAGERRVMESQLERWVSLRMSFIMPTDHADLMGLFDPIAFHMPLDTRMENVTDRDAGLAMVNCLELRQDAAFWRRAYNVGGGPGMRTTARAYLRAAYGLMGLDVRRCMDENWFGLRNFHLQYYADSEVTERYLRYQRDDLASHAAALEATMAPAMRLLTWLCRHVAPVRRLSEAVVHGRFLRLAHDHRNSPRHWYLTRNDARVRAFFGGYAAYEAIPAGGLSGAVDEDGPWVSFDHGYPDDAESLSRDHVMRAAALRGGAWLGTVAVEGTPRHPGVPGGNGEVADQGSAGDGATVGWYEPSLWRCGAGHEFVALPSTVLRGGHWCADCLAQWDGGLRATREPFFAQAWYADHDPADLEPYPAEGARDVADADVVWRARGGARRRARRATTAPPA